MCSSSCRKSCLEGSFIRGLSLQPVRSSRLSGLVQKLPGVGNSRGAHLTSVSHARSSSEVQGARCRRGESIIEMYKSAPTEVPPQHMELKLSFQAMGGFINDCRAFLYQVYAQSSFQTDIPSGNILKCIAPQAEQHGLSIHLSVGRSGRVRRCQVRNAFSGKQRTCLLLYSGRLPVSGVGDNAHQTVIS